MASPLPSLNRAINIQTPFGGGAVNGLKTIELRRTPLPEKYLNHNVFVRLPKGKKLKFDSCLPDDYELEPRGNCIGSIAFSCSREITLSEVLGSEECECLARTAGLTTESFKSAWHGGYKFAWEIVNPVRFKTPIPDNAYHDTFFSKKNRQGYLATNRGPVCRPQNKKMKS